MENRENIVNIWKSKGFIGASKLKKILNEMGIKITLKKLTDIIKEERVSQIHKQTKKNNKALGHIITFAKDNNWQIDLADMSTYSSSNKGFKYILLAIDVFSRKAHAQPIKNKSEKSVTEAFNKMIENEKPLRVTSDKGSEFISSEFKDNLNKNDISQVIITVGDHYALGLIDRLTKTLKDMTFKQFTDKNNTNWIDHLQDFINIYNNNPHGGISNISPSNVEEINNTKEILHLNIKKALNMKLLKPDISVGDIVRIKIKGTFKKGYEPNFSEEVYRVIRVTKVSAILENGTRHKFSDLQKVDDTNRDVMPFANPTHNVIQVEKKKRKAEKDFSKEGLNKDNIVNEKRFRKKVEKYNA